MKICEIFEPSVEEKSQKEKEETGKYSAFGFTKAGVKLLIIFYFSYISFVVLSNKHEQRSKNQWT
jgi:hypothetical protein